MVLGKYVEILPGAVTNWQGIGHIGVAGNTDSTDLIQGVYQYGSKSSAYPEALNYGFTISSGTETGTSLKIGAVKGIGNDLYIGWRDGSAYGVDRVQNSGAPFTTGTYESLLFDEGRVIEDKLAKVIKAHHLALAADESIQLHYKKNRGSYVDGTANATDDSEETRLNVANSDARFNDFQTKITLNASATTSPTITGWGLSFDDLKEEKSF